MRAGYSKTPGNFAVQVNILKSQNSKVEYHKSKVTSQKSQVTNHKSRVSRHKSSLARAAAEERFEAPVDRYTDISFVTHHEEREVASR